ncbi:MAG: hypothetical protein V8T36_09870 [Ruthenibacterium lactatiformans]
MLLGDELPEYRMPGFCIMTKRYLAGGGLTGAIGIVGPTRMPYRETIPGLNISHCCSANACRAGCRRSSNMADTEKDVNRAAAAPQEEASAAQARGTAA